jgi:hypothetical protein
MASKKISQLTSGSIPSLSGVTAVVYSGTTFQQTLSSLRQVLVDSGSHHFTGSQYISGNLTIDGKIPNLIVGTGSFHNDNPEVLHVENSGSYNLVHFQGNSNIYSQVNIKNTNSGTNASTDLVLTADNGSENVHYIDLGINSSTYTGGLVGYENDAYLLNVGKDLYVGTVGGISHPSQVKIFANNLWEEPQITISGSRQIAFNTDLVSNGYTYEFSGSLKLNNGTTINEIANLESVSEIIITHNNPTTGITHNFLEGSIAYVSGATSDFILNITNVPTNNNKAIGLTVIIEQETPAYKITGLQINSEDEGPVSISWYGGSQPSGVTNSTDIFAFSLIRVNNTWKVLGQKTTF